MNVLSEMLSYPFMVRALFGGMLVSLCASLLGVSLVLKRGCAGCLFPASHYRKQPDQK